MHEDKIADAEAFARAKHAGQTDKLGVPYIHHLEDVARRVAGQSAVVVSTAWLHDSVEDTDASLAEIEALFGRDVRDAVDAMTRREGEVYFADYLPRLQQNPDAVLVKIADASHNLGKAHLLAETDSERAASLEKKYRRVLTALGVPSVVPEHLVFERGAWRALSS